MNAKNWFKIQLIKRELVIDKLLQLKYEKPQKKKHDLENFEKAIKVDFTWWKWENNAS